MIEWKRREHGSVTVDFCFYQQSSASYAVELDFSLGIIIIILAGHVRHETAIGRHGGIAFKENFVWPHLLCQVLRSWRVNPVIEIVGPHVHCALVLVKVPLVAVWC